MAREIKEHEVKIKTGQLTLEGNLAIPSNAEGIVVFAHGSGSSRFSTRNQYVASVLQEAGLATLLFDLLTAEEEIIDNQTGEARFNIKLLSDRVISSTAWLNKFKETADLKIGYFGASTGAAAALVAAAEQKNVVSAVVSRGGRPDMAGDFLGHVKAPTLLVVGGNDFVVLDLNKKAFKKLKGEKDLVVIPGATHLFEEPGTLEEAAHIARDWFIKYLM